MEKWRDEKLVCLDEKKNEKMKNIFDINLLLYSYYLKYYIFIFNYITHKYINGYDKVKEENQREDWIKKVLVDTCTLVFFHIKLEKILEIILEIDGKDPLESEVGSMGAEIEIEIFLLKV